jgi:hypothetical protein
MKKLLLGILMVVTTSSYAENTPFPAAWTGIHIVPMQKQNLTIAMKKEVLLKQNEEKLRGYVNRDDNNASFLLNLKQTSVQQYKMTEKNYGVYDTHLKKDFREIKLVFPYRGVTGIDKGNMIGYAAIGAYVKENGKEGWDGIRSFFTTDMGTCSVSRMGIKAVELAKETTELLVNKKPSNKIIEGNINSGFVYTLTWYTDTTMNVFECANKSLKDNIMPKMIDMANKIDKK